MPVTSTSFKKGCKRSPNAGRRKGSENKINQTVKEIFRAALDELGGVDFIIDVCKTQRGKIAFLMCLSRLLPTTEKVHHDHDFTGLSEETLRAIVAEGEFQYQRRSLEVVEQKTLTN